MVDIFAKEGLDPPKDIFAGEGIEPPSIQERNMSALNPPSMDVQPIEVQREVETHQEQYSTLAQARFTQEQLDEMKGKGPIGFWEATKFHDAHELLPGGSVIPSIVDMVVLKSAVEKMERGEETSVNEDETLNKFIDKQVEMNVRGLSIGGGISYYGSQMPAFMTEFIATGGVGKLAQKGVQEGVKRAVASQVVSKTAGLSANVLARSAAMPGRYVPQYAELRVNDFMAITDKGQALLQESTESPAKSAMKAFLYTGAEVASEMSGAAIGKYVVGPATGAASKYLKTPISQGIQKLPVSIRQNLYNAYKAINPNASVSKVFSAAGWNGMLEELGEERISDILRESLNLAVDDDMDFEKFVDRITPDKDQLLIEAGIISIMGGVKTAADVGVNILTQKTADPDVARETVANMSAQEQENYVNENLSIKGEQLDETPGLDGVGEAQRKAAIEQSPPTINHEESGFNKAHREFVNRLQPIEDLTKAAEERGVTVDPGSNPFIMSRDYAGIIGTIEQNLRFGTTKFNAEKGEYEVVGKSLKSVLDDFDNSVAHIESDRDVREQDFEDYLIARRTLEDLDAREDVKVSQKDKLKSIESMQRLANKYGDEFNWFDTFGQEMYEYQRTVLSNLVDAGVLSQEKYNDIVKNNPNYIPFQRVLNEEQDFIAMVSPKGVFTDAKASKVIKRIHGSDKEIKSTVQSVIANTAKIIDISARNRVAKGVADLAEVMPEYVQKVKTPMEKVKVKDPETGKVIETFKPSGRAPAGTITVMRDGKREYYEVSKPLLEAMNNLSPIQLNGTLKLIQEVFFYTPARVLRAGATLIPEFWVRNVIRDQSTAFLQSPVRPTPLDMIRGLTAVMRKDDLYQDWLRHGGAFNSYMELDDSGLEKAYRELLRPHGKFARYSRNPINVLADISMALEQGTRVGAFSKARKAGVSGVEAALLSREATLDFARSGVASQKINRYIPFFNAGVQSVDKLIRTTKENPKATAFWGMATVTIPSVLITGYYLYAAPEEEREEYLEIPQWQKDMFWVFKEDGQWRRVPKPFSWGYLFGSVPERFMLWGYEGEKPEMKEFWTELAKGIAGTLSPVYDPSALIPPLFKLAIEDTTNYNFFTGRNIYPTWMERLEPEERTNKYTSETATLLGKKLGLSPALIDNTLRGSLAGSANYITDAGDAIIKQVKEWNGEEIPAEPRTPSDIPVIKAFSVREPTGYGANSVANFFDDWEKVNQKRTTFNSKEGSEKQKYREKNEQFLRAYKPMKAHYDKIRILGKQSNRIYDDVSMSSEEKVRRLSEIGDQMLEVAKRANKWYGENVQGGKGK